MLAITKRNLELYFNSKASVFFSLLGALIAFGLYLIFLQKNNVDSFASLENPEKILDFWVMGGTLAVTSITTTWTGATRLVYDRESQKLDDFLLADVSEGAIQLGYFISASIIGFIMQLCTGAVMMVYFIWQDGLDLELSQLPPLLAIMLLSSLLGAGLAQVAVQFIHSREVSERLSIIIGSASGFLVGVYMPIGQLPDFAQNFIKFTPAAYVASAYRQVFIGDDLDGLEIQGYNLNEFLGVGMKLKEMTNLNQEMLIIAASVLVSLLVFALVLWFKQARTKHALRPA